MLAIYRSGYEANHCELALHDGQFIPQRDVIPFGQNLAKHPLALSVLALRPDTNCHGSLPCEESLPIMYVGCLHPWRSRMMNWETIGMPSMLGGNSEVAPSRLRTPLCATTSDPGL